MYLGIPHPALLPNWIAAIDRARPVVRQAIAHAITYACWAIAITVTAGRLARRFYQAVHPTLERRLYSRVRPRLAQAFHRWALALDPGLTYPDQPEPAPVPTRRRTRNRTR